MLSFEDDAPLCGCQDFVADVRDEDRCLCGHRLDDHEAGFEQPCMVGRDD